MSQSAVVVRAQEPGDMPAVNEVLSQPDAIWGTLQLPCPSAAARKARREARALGENRASLVAPIDGTIVGSLGLARFDARRAHAGAFGMAVHDEYVGRGAGSALMAAMVDQADNWLGLKRLELTVWADNARAIGL
ncbi:MAG: GNAT family N-acetyltransferase [Caulobacteraceae bacterium]